MKDPERILITRTDRLGDTVLSTPVIKHLRKLYPSAHIAFMVRSGNRDISANDPNLNEVIAYDKDGVHRTWFATLKFALSLRCKRFDTAIALHPANRAHLILFLAGIPRRIGYRKKMGRLLTLSTPDEKHRGEKHEADYNFDLLKIAGMDVSGADRRPYIFTSAADKVLVDLVIKEIACREKIVALHPGASCPSKRWPAERFARVAESIQENYGSDIVVVGGEETREFSRMVVSKAKARVTDMTGKFRLGELAEFLSRCGLFISNDSGPVHVAGAVGTPSIVIFGRKDPGLSPKRWGPLGPLARVIHKDAGCEICLAHNCIRDFSCLKAVSPEEVISAAQYILDRGRSSN